MIFAKHFFEISLISRVLSRVTVYMSMNRYHLVARMSGY